MVWWTFFGLFWVYSLTQVSIGEQLSREEVLSWFKHKVLDSLGVDEAPLVPGPDVDGAVRNRRHLRRSRTEWIDGHSATRQDRMQVILFPSSESPCASSESGHSSSSHFTLYFEPSITHHESPVTSAQLWFYAGEGLPVNSSAPVFMLTSGQQLLQAAHAPSHWSQDGWSMYQLGQNTLASMAQGAFLLQVRCPECHCHTEPDKTPFLYIHVEPRGPKHSARSVTIPWSPSVLDLLQRPSQEKHGDCNRAHIEISFDELGWANWIVHPKTLAFFYCHGNCSAPERVAASLGITQCCAPVPGSMRSVRITTTSDGGYSFKYETLPNIIPEECACL